MGYHYSYGGIQVSDGKDKLLDDLVQARKRLESFKRALSAPVGSFAWEGAINSGLTEEGLKESVRHAEEKYNDYVKKTVINY